MLIIIARLNVFEKLIYCKEYPDTEIRKLASDEIMKYMSER